MTSGAFVRRLFLSYRYTYPCSFIGVVSQGKIFYALTIFFGLLAILVQATVFLGDSGSIGYHIKLLRIKSRHMYSIL
jgi:hypothetical protein